MESLNLDSPTRAFVSRWRALQQQSDHGLRPITLGVTASFTVEPLLPYLGCFLAQRGLMARMEVAPYNQIYQSLLDPSGRLRTARPDVTIVLPRAEELLAEPLKRLTSLDPEVIDHARSEARSEIDRLCAALHDLEQAPGGTGTVLCGTLPPPGNTPLGMLDASHPGSHQHLLRELNLRLWEHARASRRTLLVDVAEVVQHVGTGRGYDDRMWYLSRCPFSEALLRVLAERLARTIAPLMIAPAKVVVLDLDNTLWGGIIGEDGLDGITVGDPGIGAAFADFQEALLALRHQGVLLCLASKNNEADALEVFDKHPGMRMRREHITAHRIGWGAKSESLRELADELSLSLDSFVFMDDSPTECEEVCRRFPEVTVVQLPADPAAYVATLRAVPALDRMRLTKEDLVRADQYAAEQARQQVWQSANEGDPNGLKDFLRSLGLRLTIRRAGASDVARVAQLTQKTNQFNLTTVRRTEAEVEALLQAPDWRVYVLEVSDRFGDYGLTGVSMIHGPGSDGETFDLETLLMSCRVLGRGVETGFLVAMIGDILESGAARLSSRFIPTAKNVPARAFLPDHGFREVGDGHVVLEPLRPATFDVGHLKIDVAPATER